MPHVAWTLTDSSTGSPVIFSFPINPKEFDPPARKAGITWMAPTAPNGQPLIWQGLDEPGEGSMAGAVLTSAFKDDLDEWARKWYPMVLTDDLGNAYSILITQISWSRLATERLEPLGRQVEEVGDPVVDVRVGKAPPGTLDRRRGDVECGRPRSRARPASRRRRRAPCRSRARGGRRRPAPARAPSARGTGSGRRGTTAPARRRFPRPRRAARTRLSPRGSQALRQPEAAEQLTGDTKPVISSMRSPRSVRTCSTVGR